jgi:hypothetical protein
MRTIAIGLVALVLADAGASAQTANETARILRGFEEQIANYDGRPLSFTPPMAMVFRQVIARALATRGATAVNGVGAFPHPALLEPFPSDALHEFPRVLRDALPPLPAPLEYRLIGHDLVVRDTEADLIVGVLRDAVGGHLTVMR